jgi:small subunit ribosomal protein S3
MGQKVHPHGLRVGVIKDWRSRWFTDNQSFGDSIVEDYNIRKFIKKALFAAAIDRIEIEKKANKVVILLFAAKPGMIIGRGGAEIERIKKDLQKFVKKEVQVNIMEIRSPDLSAQLVAESIAAQLERRISYRKAMKQAMARTMKAGAKGIKTNCAGRLGGAEIARSEHYHEGTIPLQTLRADIDYGFAEANTTYGKIGVKAWIYKGEILTESNKRSSSKGTKPGADGAARNAGGRGAAGRAGSGVTVNGQEISEATEASNAPNRKKKTDIGLDGEFIKPQSPKIVKGKTTEGGEE